MNSQLAIDKQCNVLNVVVGSESRILSQSGPVFILLRVFCGLVLRGCVLSFAALSGRLGAQGSGSEGNATLGERLREEKM